jgi:hypothetical protein
MNFTKAQILAARATPFAAPVVRAVINISRTTEWRQNVGKSKSCRRLLPLNPGNHREVFLGQTVVDHVQGQCADAGLPRVMDEAVLVALLVAAEEREHRLAEIVRGRKVARQVENTTT